MKMNKRDTIVFVYSHIDLQGKFGTPTKVLYSSTKTFVQRGNTTGHETASK